MAKKANDGPEFRCPVYDMLGKLCGKSPLAGEFADHLRKAHVEVLLAVRSLIDERVAELSKAAAAPKARSRRIKVTGED